MGLARVAREGTDVTLLTYGAQTVTALDAAAAADDEGISIEVIDLRSLSPVDYRTVTASVRKTGRVVVTHEAAGEAGVGAELIASVTEQCFHYLEAAPLGSRGTTSRTPGEARAASRAGPRSHSRRGRPRAGSAEQPVGGDPVISEFRLPDLGEGPEAEIVQWLVAEGDTVTLNQPIAEVETAKAIVELPSPFAGTVRQLHAETGTVVEVGSPLIAIEVPGAGSDTPTVASTGTADEPA
jgi:biotin carboxyl carrier protein